MITFLWFAFIGETAAIECFKCQSEYGGIKCSDPCRGDVCLVWKWNTKSELVIRQGCVSGIEHSVVSIGCRTNYLGASLCLCNDGDLCNRVERTDNTLRPLPVVRLPAVECAHKVIGTGLGGPRHERVCSANYCHMTKTETYSDTFPLDILTVYNCADVPEFDFDFRIKNSIDFPGLYVNGCYRIQYQLRESVTDCICSRNHCNTVLPMVQPGPVRCYISQRSLNDSVVDIHNFCDGDFCFIQKHDGKFTKGCLSVNERNSWSHIKSGHRHIMGVDQWLCQHHLCNFNLKRVNHAISTPRSIYRSSVKQLEHVSSLAMIILTNLNIFN